MKQKRNIGHEILEGLDEITGWQSGKKKVKVTKKSNSLIENADETAKSIRKVGAVDAKIMRQFKI